MGEQATGLAGKTSVYVLSVGRDIGDEAGGEVVEALEAAGFPIAGRDMVTPDAMAVDAAIDRRLADRGPGALVVVGGTLVPGHDMSTRNIGKRLAWAVPGFAESYRALACPTLGADALLTELCGGVTAGRTLVFSLPDGPKAARLAADRLLVPLLHKLPALIDAALADAAPATTAPVEARPTAQVPAKRVTPEEDEAAAPEITAGLSVTEIKVPAPAKDSDEPKPASGWQAGLRAMGAELKREWPALPEALERLAPVRNLLDTAGQRGVVVAPDGRRYAAFGFPDLTRDSSKVLLIREAEPLAEIIALHRHPRAVGLVIEGPAGALPSADEPAAAVAERLVGRAPPTASGLWAVDQDAVYLSREGRIWRWDGRREALEGTPTSTLASLLLRWSQR